ncbi:MAG: transcriptional regulator [Myxococcales bacterium]|nr:transcriptional regulator [Myxococcales bacterium]
MNARGLWREQNADYVRVREDTGCTWVSFKRMRGHRVGRFRKFKTAEADEWVWIGCAATVAASDPDERDPP